MEEEDNKKSKRS